VLGGEHRVDDGEGTEVRRLLMAAAVLAGGMTLASCSSSPQLTFDPISHVDCTGVPSLPRSARIEAITKKHVTQQEALHVLGLAYSERVGVCTGSTVLSNSGHPIVVITIANGIPATTQSTMIPPIEHYLRSTELFSSVKTVGS
jgi:hypothetical protein